MQRSGRIVALVLVCLGGLWGIGCGGSGGGSKGGGLAVVSVSPADGATEVGVDETLSVTFGDDVDPGTVSPADVSLEAEWGVTRTAVPVTVHTVGDTLTIQPAIPLLYNATYTATVGGQITSIGGRRLAGAISWQFSTERRNIVSLGDSTVSLGLVGEAVYLIPASFPSLSPPEFVGNTAPFAGGPDFVVVDGETKSVALADLTGSTWRDFVVAGTLVVTGTAQPTSPATIVVLDNLIVTGSLVFQDRPLSVVFDVNWQTTITGLVDLSAGTPGEDGGSIKVETERELFLGGSIVTRSVDGRGGDVILVGTSAFPFDVVITGEIDVRSIAGTSGRFTVSSTGRLVLRGAGLDASGRGGGNPSAGGFVGVFGNEGLTLAKGVVLSSCGGAGVGVQGGQGGTVGLSGVSSSPQSANLDTLNVEGVVVANAGSGSVQGLGGRIYLSEDPLFDWTNNNESAPDNASWMTATISGTLEALGAGAEIRFHALDPSGAAAFEIQDGAVVRAPDGLLTRHALTSVTVTGSPTIVDSDGDQDAPPDGTPVDVK